MKAEFEAAAARIKTLKERPSNDTLLKLYALYKQATEGDVKGDRPGMFNFEARAKYDAWAGIKGKASNTAMTEYINLVNSLVK